MAQTPLDDLPLFSTGDDQAPGRTPPRQLRGDTGLSAVIVAWGEALGAAGRSEHTVKAFTADLRLLAGRLGGGVGVSRRAGPDLQNFLDWMFNRPGRPCRPQ